MEIKYNSETKKFTLEANRGEVQIIQIAIVANMSQIPSEMKEEKRMTANMGVQIDKALSTI